MNSFTYTASDIFSKMPDDSGDVLMTFPPEVMEHLGVGPGDVVDITVEDGAILIKKHG